MASWFFQNGDGKIYYDETASWERKRYGHKTFEEAKTAAVDYFTERINSYKQVVTEYEKALAAAINQTNPAS